MYHHLNLARWRLGVWGEVTNGAGNCPYTIALQLNRSTDLQLELGVVYTQSSTQPFADFFMFAITGTLPRPPREQPFTTARLSPCVCVSCRAAIPPELIVQVTADPAECPTMPRALVRFGLEPTAGDYDFAQFVRTGDMLVLNLTAPILQLVRHTTHNTRHTDTRECLTFHSHIPTITTGHVLPGRVWQHQLHLLGQGLHPEYAPTRKLCKECVAADVASA